MTRTDVAAAAEERRRSDSNITNDHGRQANNSNPLRPYMQMGSTNVHTFLSGLRETSHSFQRRFNVPLVARQPSNISTLTVQALYVSWRRTVSFHACERIGMRAKDRPAWTAIVRRRWRFFGRGCQAWILGENNTMTTGDVVLDLGRWLLPARCGNFVCFPFTCRLLGWTMKERLEYRNYIATALTVKRWTGE